MTLSADNRWPLAMAGLLLLSLLFGYLYVDTLADIVQAWNRWRNAEFYSHGYLALCMAVFMVLHERGRLASHQPCPAMVGLLLLVAAVLLWLLGELAGIQMAGVLAVLLMLFAIVWTVTGWSIASIVLPAFILLIFSLPLWGSLPPVLQSVTADAAYALARYSGLPAMLQGLVIVLPAGSLEVEESCSGIGYLLAALTLGVFYGWFYHTGWLRRLLVIVIAGMTAILANILRVYILVYVGYRTNMTDPMIDDHYFMGWYLFGGMALILMLIDGFLIRAPVPAVASAGRETVQGSNCSQRTGMLVACLAMAALVLAVGPLTVQQVKRQLASTPTLTVQLPATAGDWSGPFESQARWQPTFEGATEYLQDYRRPDAVVTLYIGYYPRQAQGRELIYYRNRIADGSDWRILESRDATVARGRLQVREVLLESAAGQQRLAWYWYRVAGQTTTRKGLAKLYQVFGQLTANTHASVVAVLTDNNDGPEAARQRLDDYLTAVGTDLPRFAGQFARPLQEGK